MLWVTCVADGTRPFRGVCYNPEKRITLHVASAMAAIRSARANTSLDIAVMYDGDAPEFLDFLAAHDVRCIQRRFSYADDPTFWPDPGATSPAFPRGILLEQEDSPLKFIARSLCGTFMRFDIPGMFPEQEYVLYTDNDVIFQRDPVLLLQTTRPAFIAGVSYGDESCHPTGAWTDTTHSGVPGPKSGYINCGILLINVQAWLKEFGALVNTAKEREWGNVGGGWDEGIINYHFKGRVQFLRRTFNWRPHWGIFDAPIVHYHGARVAMLKGYLERGFESPEVPDWAVKLWYKLGDAYGQPVSVSHAVGMTREIARHYVDLYESYT